MILMTATAKLLLSKTVTDRGRVALVRVSEVGEGFEVWSSFAGSRGFTERGYSTFDGAFQAYEKESLKLY